MPRLDGHAFEGFALPEDFAGGGVDGVDDVAVEVVDFAAVAAEVNAFLGGLNVLGGDGGGEEDFVAPDDGGGPAAG